MVPVHDYEKRYAEAFAITKIRMFKHEPFFIVGGGGGGAYSWYFTVIVNQYLTHTCVKTSIEGKTLLCFIFAAPTKQSLLVTINNIPICSCRFEVVLY